MSENGEGRTSREITLPKDNAREGAPNKNPLIPETSFEQLGRVPKTEDPAFWPVRVITELEYAINPGEMPNGPLVEKWKPFQDSLKRVKKAYEVLAYPHVRYEGWRDEIAADLKRDQKTYERDQVELDDAELAILKKLSTTAKIPFNPQKRIYNYTEVFNPSPDLPRALNGAEWITERARETKGQNEK